MKNIVVWAAMLILVSHPFRTVACDACGCAAGSQIMSSAFLMNRGFTGLVYASDRYHTVIPPIFYGETESRFQEHFQKLEWRVRIPFKSRFFVNAQVPWMQYTKESGGVSTNRQGISDPSLMLYVKFQLFNDTVCRKWTHRVFAGSGIKAPWGKRWDEVVNPLTQAGTGSWDVPMNLVWISARDKWALSADFLGRLNSASSDGYRLGNMLTQRISGMYTINRNNFKCIPTLSAIGEFRGLSSRDGQKVDYTSGRMHAAGVSADLFYRNLGATLGTAIPINQKLSDGLTETKNRYFVSFQYLFN